MFLIEVKGDIKIKALGSLHDARWQAGPDPKDLFIYIFINLYIKKINIIEEILKIVIIILINIDNFLKRNNDFSINKN